MRMLAMACDCFTSVGVMSIRTTGVASAIMFRPIRDLNDSFIVAEGCYHLRDSASNTELPHNPQSIRLAERLAINYTPRQILIM